MNVSTIRLRIPAALFALTVVSACNGGSSSEAPPSLGAGSPTVASPGTADPGTGTGTGTTNNGGTGTTSANEPENSSATDTPDPIVDEVERALMTGDALVVAKASQLEAALIETMDAASLLHADSIASIFELDSEGSARTDGSSLSSIDWDPTHDAAIFNAEFGENTPLLITNDVTDSRYEVQTETLAVIGESDARYIVMGSNPMRNYRRSATSINEEMHRFLENSLAWLTRRENLDSAPFNVVLAQLDQSYYFPDELGVQEWLDERFPGQANYNAQNACDDAALADCISAGTDLLIISAHQAVDNQEAVIANSVASAMEQGIPVLYMHLDGGNNALSQSLFPLFDVHYGGDNYWRKLRLSAYEAPTIGTLDDDTLAVRTMVKHFINDSFMIDWDACDEENCNANASLNTAFWNGARQAKSLLRNLDSEKIDLFATQDRYRYKKLLVLLGDHYRGRVSFPMDRRETPASEFMRALYADHATYQYREIVGTWSDLGNFSRTDFSNITPTSRTVAHVSKRKFKSTGAYALPGQTVTVTRKDDSEVGVKVRVNTLRDGSTHVYADNGYKRPRALNTQSIAVEPGETIRFTSAIGGPIQLEYDANEVPVEVTFRNIGEHPYWRDASDNQSFSEKLYAAEFDWAEIAAPSFEVHSTREKMVESLGNTMFGADGGTPQELVDATMRYVHNFPHVLAGFQGPGVDVVDEIHQFAADNGLSVANLNLVKHMNADQATCGYGCSGNPYDAYWSFSPIGHGDIHELGHGLERGRFRLTGWPGHSTTNFYSYYTKSQYFKDTGQNPSCQSLPFESSFNILRDSFANADPAAYVQENLWTNPGWSSGSAMIIQMMMAAEDNGALVDGWHLLARMHIIEREYQQAVRNDTAWLAAREGLGMNQYDREEARLMSPEDWLMIVVSHATGFDHTAYFDVWGHAYTAAASAQVTAMSLPSMPLNYYVSSGDGFCQGEGFDGNKVALDGIASWPAE